MLCVDLPNDLEHFFGLLIVLFRVDEPVGALATFVQRDDLDRRMYTAPPIERYGRILFRCDLVKRIHADVWGRFRQFDGLVLLLGIGMYCAFTNTATYIVSKGIGNSAQIGTVLTMLSLGGLVLGFIFSRVFKLCGRFTMPQERSPFLGRV